MSDVSTNYLFPLQWFHRGIYHHILFVIYDACFMGSRTIVINKRLSKTYTIYNLCI